MKQGSYMTDRGTAPRRPRFVAPRSVAAFHERLTPVCEECSLPLVKSDKRCPRCGEPVPWKVEA